MDIYDVSIDRPFALPLSLDALRNSLCKGHGRALMHVREFGAANAADVIIDACLHDKTFDSQCESDRTPWMREIVDAAHLEVEVAAAVVYALREADDSQRFSDTKRQCAFAHLFAERGNEAARVALYDACRMLKDSADLVAAEEVIQLDGADGLLFVAERIGEWLVERPTSIVSDAPLLWYDELHGEGAAERILTSVAAQNERIATYMAHLRSDEQDEARPYVDPDILRFGLRGRSRLDDFHKLSAVELIRFIESGAPGFGKFALVGWERLASDEESRIVLDRLLQESDPDRLARFLGVFMRRCPPGYESRLLPLAEHTDRDVRFAVHTILAQHRHPDIRALAFDRVQRGRHEENELRLFSKNYELGDWSRIKASIVWPDDERILHWIFSDLLDVAEQNAVNELSDVLLLVYEHSPCSNCRERAVRMLCTRGCAPAWLQEECRFDADAEIRGIVNAGAT